jgi:hypothetical protein
MKVLTGFPATLQTSLDLLQKYNKDTVEAVYCLCSCVSILQYIGFIHYILSLQRED